MKARWLAGATVLAVTATTLTGTVSATPAAAAPSPAIWGSFTTREVTTNPYLGTHKDVSVTWTFAQESYPYNGQVITDAVPTVNSYYEHQRTEFQCWNNHFAGWQLTDSPTSGVIFGMSAQNLMTGKSKLGITLTGNGTQAMTSYVPCGFAASEPDPRPLVSKGRSPHALMGEEIVDHSSGEIYLSPINIDMRRSGNAWYSAGSVVRQQTVASNSNTTVYVSWNIGVRNPSDQGVLPSRKKVRGKTPAAVRKVLKKAGFKGMKVYRTIDRKVRKGRVSGLMGGLGGSTSTGKCGTKVAATISR